MDGAANRRGRVVSKRLVIDTESRYDCDLGCATSVAAPHSTFCGGTALDPLCLRSLFEVIATHAVSLQARRAQSLAGGRVSVCVISAHMRAAVALRRGTRR